MQDLKQHEVIRESPSTDARETTHLAFDLVLLVFVEPKVSGRGRGRFEGGNVKEICVSAMQWNTIRSGLHRVGDRVKSGRIGGERGGGIMGFHVGLV